MAEKKLRNQKADKEQYERYKKVLGKDAPDLLDSFQEMKYTESEKYSFLELDYSKRNKLARCPELKLPGAENATAADAKFTKYLFGGRHPEGLAKGRAFESRLGYSAGNRQELQREIVWHKSIQVIKGNNGHGKDIYEQKIVMYGSKNTPANVIIGWAVDANRTAMARRISKR